MAKGEFSKDSWDTYKPYDIVEATYKPARPEHIKKQHWVDGIGERTLWQAEFIIKEGDTYGQWAFSAMDLAFPVRGWVPRCDLTDVKPVSSKQRNT